MKVQAPLETPIRQRVASLLDGYHIDYATFLVVHLYADREQVSRAFRDPGSNREVESWRLLRIRDSLMSQIPEDKRTILIYLALIRMLGDVINLSELAASWAYVDSTRGGCMEPFKPEPLLQPNGDLTPEVRANLYSDAWIREYVDDNPEIRWVHYVHARLDKYIEDLQNVDAVLLSAELLNLDIDCQRSFAREVNPVPRVDRKQRKALCRSLTLANSILPPADVKKFIRGDFIVLPGQAIDLSLKLRGSLYAEGHGACGVCVLSKSGDSLADLCVYFEETPVLDQVVGFALHMLAGLEEELLTASNLTRVHPAGARHYLIRPLARDAPQARRAGWIQEMEYLDDTKTQWRDACLDSVFGEERASQLRRAFLDGRDQRAALTDGLAYFP